MGVRRLRTADYNQEARNRLGDAVTNAREAAGHRFRPSFARAANISVRSLEAVEQGEAGVGATVLRSIARALPGWDENTPRVILEGGQIPPTVTPARAGDRADAEDEYIAAVRRSAPKHLQEDLIKYYLWRRDQSETAEVGD